jgi:mevalonate pyrophosphate decarboxylase
MTTAIRISDKLEREARLVSTAGSRSVTDQIEYWAKIGKCAEENPNLTYDLIKDILAGIEEIEQGECSEYKFG